MVKNLPANAGDTGLIPGLGRFPGGGNSNPLQYSCLENPMDRGVWQATVHGVAKYSDTTEQLSMHACTFKNRVSFLQSYNLPVYKPFWPSKPDILGAHLLSAGLPGLGSPKWISDPLVLWEKLCNYDCPPVCGSDTCQFFKKIN